MVTIAGAADALPGTEAGSVKVTPFDLYPGKGRATGGVRAHRFLKGEDTLILAWVGATPPRALGSGGQPVELPAVDARRDGSGTPLAAPVTGSADLTEPVLSRLSILVSLARPRRVNISERGARHD